MLFTSVNIFPLNLYVANLGFIGWFIVGMLWHDRALIVLIQNINVMKMRWIKYNMIHFKNISKLIKNIN